ncbi:choice-of-anchor L domain-containing protein [Glutamicibacter endophyticus]|uniref:choice-of-anchor L domain-containing protein n=1 Tax=Glutamicibacter endophyticus TaxID=1522174 RepID=UPI003AF0CFFE
MTLRRTLGASLGAAALTVTSLVAPAALAAEQKVTDLSDPSVLSAQKLAESLVGDNTEISNVKYTGDPISAGTVQGFGADLGIDEGVVLTSGAVSGEDSILLGPNDDDGTSVFVGAAGDADLDAIVDPNSTGDAAVLEFDFVPDAKTVTFSYVFGSEEYTEFVGTEYNDVFGFFVNGTNHALISTADGAQPITVNTINDELNSGFYRDNSDADPKFNVELDGFTTVLKFEAPVKEGQVNHIKLAIADTSDLMLDSAVVIAAGSFKSNAAPVAEEITTSTPIDTAKTITLLGSDPDGDELTYSVVEGPDASEGTLGEINGDKVEFTPAEGFTGEVTFTYKVSDGSKESEPTTVTVVVEQDPGTEPSPSETPEPTESEEPSQSPEPSETPEPSQSPEPSETPEPTASEEPSQSPEPSESPEPSASEEPSVSPEPSESTEPSASDEPSESQTPAPSSSSKAPAPSKKEDDVLAETGASTATGVLAVGAGLLMLGGAVSLIMRRRTKH